MSERQKYSECKDNERRTKNTGELGTMFELDSEDEMDEIIKELDTLKGLSDIPIPDELDDYIQKGLTKGIKTQKAWQFRKWSTLIACVLLAVFITTVRVSPAVAAVLHRIPGLGYIVRLINYDKGLQSALENDFIQPLGVSDEHENVVFTVDGIIMDESSLVIFYTVKNNTGHGIVDFSEVKLSDEMGKTLEEVSISTSSAANPDQDGDGKVQSKINVYFNDHTVIPNRLALKVKLAEIIKNEPAQPSNQLSSTWDVTIPVDKDKFAGMKTVYEVNQSVVIERQKITFEKVTVYPTRIALKVSYDPANSKMIFGFDDLTLVNEKGEEWGGIMNGVSGSRIDENHEVLFFQSNYFTQPKKLFLRGKSIRALDKKDMNVTLDLDKESILEGPPNLALDQVIKNPAGKVTELYFALRTNSEYDKNRSIYILSNAFTDAQGKSFNSNPQGMWGTSEKPGYDQTITVALPDNTTYQSPITFQLVDYPSRITGEFNIRIK